MRKRSRDFGQGCRHGRLPSARGQPGLRLEWPERHDRRHVATLMAAHHFAEDPTGGHIAVSANGGGAVSIWPAVDVHPCGWSGWSESDRLVPGPRDEQGAKGRYEAMDQRTVLLVEDDAAVRGLVAVLLDAAGYAVLEADRGKLALRLAQEHVPSVVLVDHNLPDMSGLDLLERLRTHRASRHIGHAGERPRAPARRSRPWCRPGPGQAVRHRRLAGAGRVPGKLHTGRRCPARRVPSRRLDRRCLLAERSVSGSPR